MLLWCASRVSRFHFHLLLQSAVIIRLEGVLWTLELVTVVAMELTWYGWQPGWGRSEQARRKYKVHPRTDYESPEGEQRYSSTLSLTSPLAGSGLSIPRPSHLTPGKDPVPIVEEAGWAPGPVCKGAGNLAPPHTGIRSTDRPARSKSLYRLSYPPAPPPRRDEDKKNLMWIVVSFSSGTLAILNALWEDTV
jgi:hypothetical protein